MAIHTVISLPSGKFSVVLVDDRGDALAQHLETPSLHDASMLACRLNGGCAAELNRLANMLEPVLAPINRLLAQAEEEARRG